MHRIQHLHPRHSLGFTLIELMVAVSVLGVLLAIALPSFQPLIERWRVRQVGNALENSLYYARSEAMKRGGNITMEKLGNTAGACQNANTTQDWGCGWVICIDANNNGTCNATETKLQEVSLSPESVTIPPAPSTAPINIPRCLPTAPPIDANDAQSQ